MSRKTVIHILLTLVAVVLYVPFLGSTYLFDWDEINFAESAREMLVSGDWGRVQIAFEPFWEKPPFFIWLQAISMKIFGVNEFAARFPNALAGIVSINLFYHIGRKHISHFFGLFFALAYAGSLAPGLYFKTGIIDPVFNLFIFLSVYQLFLAEKEKTALNNPRLHYLMAGFWSGLAVLTKGPVALLIAGLVALVRLAVNGRYAWPGFGNLLLILLSFCMVVGAWLAVETALHGTWFIREFMAYQVVLFKGQIEWHNQPWYYHVVVLFFLCFPASVFAWPFLFRSPANVMGGRALLFSYMRTLFWVVLVVFSAVTTKIIHYSSLCWIPLSFLAAYGMYGVHTNRYRLPGWLAIPAFISVIPVAAFFSVAPILLHPANRSVIAGLLSRDEFTTNLLLKGQIWSGWEAIPSMMFLVFVMVWLIRYGLGMTRQPAALFIAVLCFTQAIYIFLLPKAGRQLQEEVISAIKTGRGPGSDIESWHYKTFAILFYGKVAPRDFKGPWESKARELPAEETLPVYTARKHWYLDSGSNRKIFILTRCDYEPDPLFLLNFNKVGTPGPYILWERKRP